jgi:hypothetical protein
MVNIAIGQDIEFSVPILSADASPINLREEGEEGDAIVNSLSGVITSGNEVMCELSTDPEEGQGLISFDEEGLHKLKIKLPRAVTGNFTPGRLRIELLIGFVDENFSDDTRHEPITITLGRVLRSSTNNL